MSICRSAHITSPPLAFRSPWRCTVFHQTRACTLLYAALIAAVLSGYPRLQPKANAAAVAAPPAKENRVSPSVDFPTIVERYGPAVVHISTVSAAVPAQRRRAPQRPAQRHPARRRLISKRRHPPSRKSMLTIPYSPSSSTRHRIHNRLKVVRRAPSQAPAPVLSLALTASS